MKAKTTIPAKGTLPEPPLKLQGPSVILEEIAQTEIVEVSTAFHIFRVARADFEAKRGALILKLLQYYPCTEGDYFAMLDEHGDLVIEDRTSLEVGTGRPILDREFVPSGGAA
jgi:hypothetical protein